MPIEIERKFRVRDGRWRACVERSVPMRQGYLGGDACSIRVRREGGVARLNIKSRELGVQRLEFEYPLPVDEAQTLLASFCASTVSKTRHYVPHGGLTIEVDEFDGDNAGLVVAEIELSSVDQVIEPPPWLGAEVTDERRYFNLNLAAAPFLSWADREQLRYRD